MNKLINTITDLPKFFWVVVGGIVSLTAYIIIEKFKNRLSLFSSKIVFNPIGTSYSDKIFGEITVKHQNRDIKHLNFITITVKNISNSDFEDLIMMVWVDARSQILAHNGNYIDNLSSISLSDEFVEKNIEFLDRVNLYNEQHPGEDLSNALLDEFNIFGKNKEFRIQVLNRGSSFYINLLVENFDGNVPICQYPILHKGVKMIPERDDNEKNKELGKAMLIWGYILFSIYSFFFLRLSSFGFNDILLFVIFSGVYIWIGLFFHLFVRYIKSVFR